MSISIRFGLRWFSVHVWYFDSMRLKSYFLVLEYWPSPLGVHAIRFGKIPDSWHAADKNAKILG
jgi:hypothetical protein